mmetsp:Transcript_10015/g.22457  ORF Transcript_10015/g.22457 Transcript_10015/m.22457 type:complete len:450 (-) Transcript_10015:51-1400(-)
MNRENRVWVGGLPQNVKEDELSEAFGACGTVTKIQIRHSQIDTFAFVSFADRKGYDKALATMDQSKFFGQPMKVNVVIQKGEEGGRSSGRDRDRDRGDRDDRGRDYRDRSRRREDSRRPSRRRDDDRGYRGRSRSDRDRTPPRYRDRDRDRSRSRSRDRDRGSRDRDRDRDRYDDRNGARDDSREAGRRYDRRRSPDRRTRDPSRDRRSYDRRSTSRPRDRDGDARRGRDFSPDDRPQRTYSRMDDDGGSRIWVGGMPKNITESEIDHVFKRYGPVEEIVIRHSEFDTFGFVQFKNTSHASAAIKDLDQASRFGVTIKVAYAGGKSKGKGKGDGRDGKGGDRKGGGGGGRPRSARSRSRDNDGKSGVRHCVRLENLPNDMEADELLELAKEYGKVLHHEVWSDAKSRTNGGMIEYGTKEEGAAALDALNDRAMDGWDKKIQARYEQRDG